MVRSVSGSASRENWGFEAKYTFVEGRSEDFIDVEAEWTLNQKGYDTPLNANPEYNLAVTPNGVENVMSSIMEGAVSFVVGEIASEFTSGFERAAVRQLVEDNMTEAFGVASELSKLSHQFNFGSTSSATKSGTQEQTDLPKVVVPWPEKMGSPPDPERILDEFNAQATIDTTVDPAIGPLDAITTPENLTKPLPFPSDEFIRFEQMEILPEGFGAPPLGETLDFGLDTTLPEDGTIGSVETEHSITPTVTKEAGHAVEVDVTTPPPMDDQMFDMPRGASSYPFREGQGEMPVSLRTLDPGQYEVGFRVLSQTTDGEVTETIPFTVPPVDSGKEIPPLKDAYEFGTPEVPDEVPESGVVEIPIPVEAAELEEDQQFHPAGVMLSADNPVVEPSAELRFTEDGPDVLRPTMSFDIADVDEGKEQLTVRPILEVESFRSQAPGKDQIEISFSEKNIPLPSLPTECDHKVGLGELPAGIDPMSENNVPVEPTLVGAESGDVKFLLAGEKVGMKEFNESGGADVEFTFGREEIQDLLGGSISSEDIEVAAEVYCPDVDPETGQPSDTASRLLPVDAETGVPRFVVTNLDVTPPESLSDSLVVDAEVENQGDAAGDVVLVPTDLSGDAETVTLEPEEAHTETFEHSPSEWKSVGTDGFDYEVRPEAENPDAGVEGMKAPVPAVGDGGGGDTGQVVYRGLSVLQDTINPGDPFTVRAEIANTNDQWEDATVTGPGGDTRSVSIPPNGAQFADFDLTALPDPGQMTKSVSVNGEEKSVDIDVVQEQEPAFEVTDVTAPELIPAGVTPTIAVTVTNTGTAGGEVTVEQEPSISDRTVFLPAGGSRTFEFTPFAFDPGQEETFEYKIDGLVRRTVTVEAEDAPGDIGETTQWTIVPNVNQDRVVDGHYVAEIKAPETVNAGDGTFEAEVTVRKDPTHNNVEEQTVTRGFPPQEKTVGPDDVPQEVFAMMLYPTGSTIFDGNSEGPLLTDTQTLEIPRPSKGDGTKVWEFLLKSEEVWDYDHKPSTLVAKPVPANPAEFALTALNAESKVLEPEEPPVLTAVVENTGGQSGEVDVSLGDETETVFVPPGEEREAVFQPEPPNPGAAKEYTVQAAGESESVSVEVEEGVSKKPSFELLDVGLPSEVTAGEEYNIGVDLENAGDAAGQVEIVSGSRFDRVTLDPGEAYSTSFSFNAPSAGQSSSPSPATQSPSGEVSHTVQAVNSQTGEVSDEKTVSRVVEPAPKPAFNIAGVEPPGEVQAGDSYEIVVDVVNTGEKAGVAAVEIDGQRGTVNLAPGEEGSSSRSFTAGEDGVETRDVRVVNTGTGSEVGTESVDITVSELPRAAFDIVELNAPMEVTPDDGYSVEAVVRNVGETAGTARVDIDGRRQSVSLGIDEESTVTRTFSPSGVGSEARVVEVINERTGETTDTQAVEVEVVEPKRASFALESTDVPSSVQVGGQYTLTALVRNTGDQRGAAEVSVGENTRSSTIAPGQTSQAQFTLTAQESEGRETRVVTVRNTDTGSVAAERSVGVGVEPEPQPFFDLTGLDVPQEVQVGKEFVAEVSVANAGNADGPVTISHGDATQELTIPTDAEREVALTLSEPQPGPLAVEVAAENGATGVVDDTIVEDISVTEAPKPSFRIRRVDAPSFTTAGETYSISVLVGNTGDADGEAQVSVDDTTQTRSVPAGESVEPSFTQGASQPGVISHDISVTNGATGETQGEQTVGLEIQPEPEPEPEPIPEPEPEPKPIPEPPEDGETYDGPLTYLDPLGLFGTTRQLPELDEVTDAATDGETPLYEPFVDDSEE